MEGLQGHIDHNSCGEHMSLESLEGERLVDYLIYESCMPLDHAEQTPFLPMLLEEQNQQPNPSEPGSFLQLLLRPQEERLRKQQPQHHRPLLSSSSISHWTAEVHACPPARPLEPESCVTYASETTLSQNRDNDNQHHHHHHHHFRSCKRDPAADTTAPAAATREESTGKRTRRKRPRPKARDMEELECQRRAHIAVERNRRKLMNDYLCSLQSLVSPSFIQRGDQASIVGGAIEYVKELEHLLQSLQAEKWMRSCVSTAAETSLFHSFFTSPQYTLYTLPRPSTSTPPPSSSTASSPSSSSSWVMKADGEAGKDWPGGGAGESSPTVSTAVADIEATVVHTHVNLKVLSPRRPGQLLRAIAALEDLHLSVLHLNITTFDCAVLYSLNLKIEEECTLGSADEIATMAHQILSLVNSQLPTHQ